MGPGSLVPALGTWVARTKSCYTVGGYYRPYVARWKAASGKWTVTRPRIRAGYDTVRMTALDWPTPTFCMGWASWIPTRSRGTG
jgi:L-amino acid N-acyltransferase YncA